VDEAKRRALAADLAKRGFLDSKRAVATLETIGEAEGDETARRLVAAAAPTADPDLALARLEELDVETRRQLIGHPTWLGRVAAVMGGSRPLGRHLVQYPSAMAPLRHNRPLRPHDPARIRRELFATVRAALGESVAASRLATDGLADPQGAGADALRLANRGELARIASRDLGSPDPAGELVSVFTELTDLADAVVDVALALARGQVAGAERVRLAVVALGKCGARELNYLSDVDVLFVAEPADDSTTPNEAVRLGAAVASALVRLTSASTPAGSIWAMDAGLRPEGNAGPLVRTLQAMDAYYHHAAAGWEFQALMKARPMAGDMALGQAFCELVRPLVWTAGGREGFVTESRAMRRRVVSLIPAAEADRDIKLGAGGLRDVEFSAQILQLVHGRGDDALRQPATLDALAALSEHSYMSPDDAAALADAYRFERLLEHRQQLFRLRRTHLMPSQPAELRRLARSLRGVALPYPEPAVSPPGRSTPDSGQSLWSQWRQTAAQVQRLQARVFYSPLLEAVAKVSSKALRLSSEAAGERLVALGFADPAAALRHIAALTQGVSRAAEITRHVMPAVLGWLAEGANPDAGLLAFRQVSEALGHSPWYLSALRDESGTAERLARVVSSSRYAVDLLRRDPPSVALLRDARHPGEDDLARRTAADLTPGFVATVGRHDDADEAARALRAARRHELARLGLAAVLGRLDVEALGAALSDVTAATLEAGLTLAARQFPSAAPVGIVAMGRWGGRELSFASDADVLFVAPDDVDDKRLATTAEAMTALRGWLSLPGPDPSLEVDVRLRPEGKDGPLVRTVSSYLAYYGRWSWTWEAQALVRASHGAGDQGLTDALLSAIAPLRWPVGGLSADDVRDIRALKMRLERERGAGRAVNLKLGAGGLTDVEWTVQLLQLSHAGRLPELRVTGTLAALRSAAGAGLVEPGDAKTFEQSWRLISRVRDAIVLARGKAADTLPSDARDVATVAMLLGYGKAEASRLVDDLTKAMRQSARVAERLFWGR